MSVLEEIALAEALLERGDERALPAPRGRALPRKRRAGGTALGPPAGALQIVLPAPARPADLAVALIGAGHAGLATPLPIRQAITVPSDGTATIRIPVATGNVVLVKGKVTAISSLYSSSVLVTLSYDELHVLIEDYPMTAAAETELAEYVVIRNMIEAVVSNALSQSIEFTFTADAVLISDSHYNRRILPTIEKTTDAIAAAAYAPVPA